LRSGQTTTLFSSETEKDPVSEARGGIASSIYPRTGRAGGQAGGDSSRQCSSSSRQCRALWCAFNGGGELGRASRSSGMKLGCVSQSE